MGRPEQFGGLFLKCLSMKLLIFQGKKRNTHTQNAITLFHLHQDYQVIPSMVCMHVTRYPPLTFEVKALENHLHTEETRQDGIHETTALLNKFMCKHTTLHFKIKSGLGCPRMMNHLTSSKSNIW